MTSQPTLVLDRVLRVLQPLVRLLVRNGVTYTVLAAALKRLFLQAAQQELKTRGMADTDSAITLLCGVHRRDVRLLLRGTPQPAEPGSLDAADSALARQPELLPLGLVAQVVARWMNDVDCTDATGQPRVLPPKDSATGPGLETLVARISSDVRARAVRDELVRLGVAAETQQGLQLTSAGFAPRQGFAELADLFADNLSDHAAAAVANLQGEANFLEQAVFVDQISEASVQQLQQAAVLAWKQAFKSVMSQAQTRFDADARLPDANQRNHRARIGIYFYGAAEDRLS